MMLKQQIRKLKILQSFLQQQLQQQKTINSYHQAQLQNIIHSTSNKTENYESEAQSITLKKSSVESESLKGVKISDSPQKTHKVLNNNQKIDSFGIQFLQLSKQISKLNNKLSNGQSNNNKSNQSLLLKSKEFLTKSKILSDKKDSKESNIKVQNQLKSMNRSQLILKSLGSLSWIGQKDDILQNLIKNLEKQQKTYVQLTMKEKQSKIRDKMTRVMQKSLQRNQQTQFRLKQHKISNQQGQKFKNRAIVKSGYTQKMKKVIQSKKSLQNISL